MLRLTRLSTIGLVLLLVAAACSGDGANRQVDQPIPFLEPDGPLHGLVMATGIADDGSIIDPTFRFATDDLEATAIVALGEDVPEDATLTVAWYRLAGVDGREHLFSHEVTVGPGGHAFSQGVASGGLAPDVYETVATLGDWRVRTPWVVRAPDEGTGGLGAGGGGSGPLALVLQTSAEEPAPPSPGDSGHDPLGIHGPPTGPPPGGPPPDSCTPQSLSGSVDPGPVPDVEAEVQWGGPCSSMVLTGTVSGPPQTLASTAQPSATRIDLPSHLSGGGWVCRLPGGSDMPGTVVRFAATGSEGATLTESLTLPDVGDTLAAAVESKPEAGSHVEPASTITVEALGMLYLPALGLDVLNLYADGELFDFQGNKSGTDEPIPCDVGRIGSWIRESKYEVPADPPPIIEICAEAVGFDGTKARDCIEFYAGEVWEGTFTYDYSGPSLTCSVDYSVKFGVSEGEVSGDITLENSSCPGAAPASRITGTKTDSAFSFQTPSFGAGEFAVPITGGNRATATFSSVPEEIRVLDVRCVSCE